VSHLDTSGWNAFTTTPVNRNFYRVTEPLCAAPKMAVGAGTGPAVTFGNRVREYNR
jgi:hypothetical protein